MPRASTAISLLLVGSAVVAWSYEQDRLEQRLMSPRRGYPTTNVSGGGNYGGGYHGGGYWSGAHYVYYPTHSSGWFGPSYDGGSYSYSDGFSGVTRGGFGSIGHGLGGHS
jgi:hypothetical protein